MRGLFLVLIVTLAIPLQALASDLAVYGPGNMPCTGWLYGREQTSPHNTARILTEGAEMWVLGYLSAANVYELHFAPAGPLTANSIFAWIDDYCRAHPDDRINVAIQAMIATTRLER